MEVMQNLIFLLTRDWERDSNWVSPDMKDAVCFVVTEAGETLDAVLRLQSYVRNHPEEGSRQQVAEELGDVVFMAMVTANIMGFDLAAQIGMKLREMCKAKGMGELVTHIDYARKLEVNAAGDFDEYIIDTSGR